MRRLPRCACLFPCALVALASGGSPGGAPDYLVVLEGSLAGSGYERAARRLAQHRAGEVRVWEGDWGALEELLSRERPTWLALVLAPGSIDANLPRRLVPILTRFDEDPFVDCAFGIVTGATDDDAERFVHNVVRASKANLPLRRFEATSVVVDECRRIEGGARPGPVARALDTTSLWVTGKDPQWAPFLERHRGAARGSGYVEWGHCGDSQGIWLFSMYRNMERDKHWEYAPEKVGWDPSGEMPRMTPALLLTGVDLFPAVVVNGSCHSGVTRDTIVAADIVSTFGDTGGRVRFHPIAPHESFPLMAIAHGATAYIAPLAANNANRAAIEEWLILAGGTPLGQVMKRTYDELVMGSAQGVLSFELFRDGEPAPRESPMFHDTVQRVLFGDPAFLPWREPVATTHRVEVERVDGEKGEGAALRISVAWDRLADDPWVWDPWLERRDPRGARGRIYELIPLAQEPAGAPRVEVLEAFTIKGQGRTAIGLEAFALLERDLAGRPVLHLKASGRREDLDARGLEGPDAARAVFAVRFE